MSLANLIDRIFRQASTSDASSPSALLSLINEAQAQAQSLSLFSSNDTIDDLPTSSLRAVLLESLHAQTLSRLQTRPGDFDARKSLLNQSQNIYLKFLSLLLSLRVLDRGSRLSYHSLLANQSKSAVDKRGSPFPTDATNRRAIKIAALKLERALKNALSEFRVGARAKASNRSAVKSTGQGWSNEVGSDASTSTLPRAAAAAEEEMEIEYDVLILPKGSSLQDDEEDEEDEDRGEAFIGGTQTHDMEVSTPSSLRSYLLMLCHLHALLALSALDSIVMELTLLSSMPSNAQSLSQEREGRERHEAEKRQNEDQEEWKLDQRWGSSNTAPLLDAKGKPNRPFTILPSGSSAASGQSSMGVSATQNQLDARTRLREQVFQSSHRLPTMSIDEFLEEEQRRGNIITGGGQASADAPTSSELLSLRSQGHGVGTREAEDADDQQRRKANDWDDFAESNPKGMGNTMNRG
ncbi:hypothetical protein CBS101457_001140 [Exobasidium rhododendri]|nr:hypothetical protein CBS101457_001140 [Exobasidium rhododendri]